MMMMMMMMMTVMVMMMTMMMGFMVVVMVLIVLLSWYLAGARVAIFTAAALAYLALFGFWEKSMLTVALLGTASFISISLGIPIGVWCARNNTVYSIVRPVLDFMQTMPVFAYLVPALMMFGYGPAAAMVVTLIYAMPPMARVTKVALTQVSSETVEFGRMAGCSLGTISTS